MSGLPPSYSNPIADDSHIKKKEFPPVEPPLLSDRAILLLATQLKTTANLRRDPLHLFVFHFCHRQRELVRTNILVAETDAELLVAASNLSTAATKMRGCDFGPTQQQVPVLKLALRC